VGGLAVDLAGRRRARTTRRVANERAPSIIGWLSRMIVQAQVDVSVGEVIASIAVLSFLGFTLVSLFTGLLPLAVPAAAVAGSAPVGWLRWRRRAVERRFEKQLLDTISLLAGSVRAGHSLLQALENVTTEAPEPTRSAIALVVREIGLGASQESALERLADRMPSDDLELIVSAINVHQQIGGSLAKVLDAISETIRDRVRVAGDIKGLTAQQRYSAYVLSVLPVVAAVALFTFSPDYAGVLLAAGPLRVALIAAAGMVVGGFLIMNRIAAIVV
jgi:tight adherence protein B